MEKDCANAMLYKVTEFVNTIVQKLIYHAVSDLHLNYANTVWSQSKNSRNRLSSLQKKAPELLFLNVKMLHQTLFSKGVKLSY